MVASNQRVGLSGRIDYKGLQNDISSLDLELLRLLSFNSRRHFFNHIFLDGFLEAYLLLVVVKGSLYLHWRRILENHLWVFGYFNQLFSFFSGLGYIKQLPLHSLDLLDVVLIDDGLSHLHSLRGGLVDEFSELLHVFSNLLVHLCFGNEFLEVLFKAFVKVEEPQVDDVADNIFGMDQANRFFGVFAY